MKRIICIFLALIMLITIVGCQTGPKQVDPIDDNFRVFYEIFTGSFSDSDGDGIGDLRGIINRVDYLNDGNINSGKSLGIQGIWLTPIFSSPSYHKYDVQDYYKIDSTFGTIDDLKELINVLHERNVKLILDLPLNHTSNINTWFVEFLNAHKKGDTSNEYYDYYSYCKRGEKPSGRTFSSIQGTDEMYEANFTGEMPELNFDNPVVREKMVSVAKYYLDMGVDGFRIDAAKYVYYGDTDKNVEFYDWYIGELKKIKEDVYCVGEVWSNDIETINYFSSLNCFNFQMGQVSGNINTTAAQGNVNIYTNYVENYIKSIHEKNEDAMLIPFIANHDTDRAAGFLTLASKRMHMAANLYILCYGSPFIYYGEEIGMKGTRGSSNTDANRRLAMLWGDDDTVKDPIGTTYSNSKQTNGTVKSQLADEDSLLNYYIKLIAFRNKYPAIARGEYTSLNLSGTNVGGFKIVYEGKTYYLIHSTLLDDSTIDVSGITNGNLSLLGYIGQGKCSLKDKTLSIGMQTSVLLSE